MNAIPLSAAMFPIPLRSGFGLLHCGQATTSRAAGVVLCSAWGIQELSSRKLLFTLASRLAAAGVPTIRFDYPATADLLDQPAEGLGDWIGAALDAADSLKALCGAREIVFIGLGIGATIAALAAARRTDVSGMVLAAPVVSGRRYLRETTLAAGIVEEELGLDPNLRPSGVSIGGIVLPPAVAEDLKTTDLMNAELGRAASAMIVERPSQPQEAALGDRLQQLGWSVTRAAFEGYDLAMDNPTLSVMPEKVLGQIVAWCERSTSAALPSPSIAQRPPSPRIEGPAYSQTPLTFGRQLFGVLTVPVRRTSAPVVVFLNSGYDHHAGWAYQWTRAAHSLAQSGIASLRFDMANIGDSAAKPEARPQVLYDAGQQQDITAALDMLTACGEQSIVLVGRCSGAFAGFHATAREERVKAAILINPLRIIWDPDENVDVALRTGPRSMADYRRRALSRRTVTRLLSGDIDIPGVAQALATQALRRIARRLAPLAGTLSKTTRLRRRCREMIDVMSRRGTLLRFVCSQGDASLEQMAFYFGGNFKGLGRFGNATISIVPDADHNMTPQAAQEIVIDIIRGAVTGLATAAGDAPAASSYEPRDVARPTARQMSG